MSQTQTLSGASILVVGGAGFVGGALCRHLLKLAPRRLTIVDNLLSADIANVPEHDVVEFIPGSIADDRVLTRLSADLEFVFHLACYHGNQSSILDPITDHQNNTLTTLKLFERLKDMPDLRKVVYSAAGCAVARKTFDTAQATAEDAPVSLIHDSPYSISKLVGEMYGNYYFRQHGLPYVAARFQNVYGPGEILGAGQWRGTPATVWRNVVPTFIWKALHGEALPVENGGIASRDFVFVDDIAQGLMACATNGTPGEAYNMASGVETSIGELAETINRLAGNSTPVAMAPARPWDHSGKRFGDPSKSRHRLGFAASVTLEDGLERTIRWTRDNRSRILAAMRRHARFVPEVKAYG
ncbi:NAD-dependent epimerase/dehydratase family protein [Magnetospirillum sp. SS-4]|uniref:NAD-dependent epimerase/dehydratase family protein n=1 Tax=Magnetospirillum sp. SS-4 TaxID=2681465 RepID=UPI00137C6BBB|nr:NAD-dependent epimerase/dehydratase family protein [Magnetospirillum sp. SS-4]CAA7617731.1 Nucleotide sugar epimerase [Magnetospirillum sp. SS-4]